MNDVPIRILQVFGILNRGGAETFIMNVYRNINRSKIQFDFIVHSEEKGAYEDEIEKLGGKIYRVPTYKGKNHFKYKKAWCNFFKTNLTYRIIHGHMRSTASIYLKIAKQFGLKTIIHSHSTSSGKGLNSIVKNIMQYNIRYIADYLFACSKVAGLWLYGNKFCKHSNFYIINNAIDTEKFIYNEEIREQKRKELNIENKFVVGNVSRFAPPKNHMFLLDIFSEISKENSNTALMLVGDGELRGEIENRIEILGLKDNIILTGLRSDVNDLLQTMDIFLFPSLWEGFPVTLVEAQTSGLHCVVSDSITEEGKITNLAEYVSLKKSTSYWAEQILHYTNGYERKNMQEEIIKAGFDIKKTAYWLQKFYLGV
ncbi:MAG: glycosyltransferase family 1 protein [Oscillospiraceae bacterium]|nr:glycosyltransferase family 1 protein [Oscillospiraceae bacterium]